MSDDPASTNGLHWEIRRSLIERLRIPWDAMGDIGNQQRAEAAVQISTMMDEIEAWQNAMRKAERDIAQLRAERDEARRQVCWSDDEHAHVHLVAVMRAEQRGWDCFKEKA
jgi:hypothetical protein